MRNSLFLMPLGLYFYSLWLHVKARSIQVFLIAIPCALLTLGDAQGAFTSRFSITLGEEYNDNIFFSEKKDHDFITFISPSLSLFYVPPSQTIPTFTASLTAPVQAFARHSELNNFADNVTFNAGYTYNHSPRLTLHFSDTLRRLGQTRTAGSTGGEDSQLPGLPTTLPPSGTAPSLPASSTLGDFLSVGNTIINRFEVQGTFRYTPTVELSGSYATGITAFLDQGGSESSHSANLRGVYLWRDEHRIHVGYQINVLRSRASDNNIIHDFNFGDDFLTQKIELTPTLTLSASTGISLNTGSRGPRVANNSTVTLIKLWEGATLTAGLRKGLTNSFGTSGSSGASGTSGTSGVSDTTTLFTTFNIALAENLTAGTGLDYSLFDTDGVDSRTLLGQASLQYWITSWLSSTLRYSFRWRDSGSGPSTDIIRAGSSANSNSVFLTLASHFDIWPNVGLARTARPPLPGRAVTP